jgi:transcription termination/antitermination protein NusA
MSKIVYDSDLLKLMNLFEQITKANLKDCFTDDNGLLTFIVQEGEAGKAIGKKAVNVRNLEKMLNRKIKIVEFNPHLLQFVKNLIIPLKVEEITQEEKIVMLRSPDMNAKGLLIGRNAKNLRNTEKIVKKYFDIDEIKVM